jgi:hypothetical protein
MNREFITLHASVVDMAVNLQLYVVAFGPNRLAQTVASKFLTVI